MSLYVVARKWSNLRSGLDQVDRLVAMQTDEKTLTEIQAAQLLSLLGIQHWKYAFDFKFLNHLGSLCSSFFSSPHTSFGPPS